MDDVLKKPEGKVVRIPFPSGELILHTMPGMKMEDLKLALRQLLSRMEQPSSFSIEEMGNDGNPSRSSQINGEDVTEDLVRWADGYAAYKITGQGWRWIRWAPDTGEQWGLGGPRDGAVAERSGLFDSFDDTLNSLTLRRAQDLRKDDEE